LRKTQLFETLNIDDVIHCFNKYITHSNQPVSQKSFLENIEAKLKNPTFLQDIIPLLPQRAKPFEPEAAYEHIKAILLEKL